MLCVLAVKHCNSCASVLVYDLGSRVYGVSVVMVVRVVCVAVAIVVAVFVVSCVLCMVWCVCGGGVCVFVCVVRCV